MNKLIFVVNKMLLGKLKGKTIIERIGFGLLEFELFPSFQVVRDLGAIQIVGHIYLGCRKSFSLRNSRVCRRNREFLNCCSC
jgi:hypothetical protein